VSVANLNHCRRHRPICEDDIANQSKRSLNAEHGSGFVATLGQLVEEHQLLDVAVGTNAASQISLKGKNKVCIQ
jgi:hypothetical protein